MARIAHGLHALHCGKRKRIGPLTEGILAAVLDGLHAKTAERVAAGDAFPTLWASDTFLELLENRVVEKKKPAGDGNAA